MQLPRCGRRVSLWDLQLAPLPPTQTNCNTCNAMCTTGDSISLLYLSLRTALHQINSDSVSKSTCSYEQQSRRRATETGISQTAYFISICDKIKSLFEVIFICWWIHFRTSVELKTNSVHCLLFKLHLVHDWTSISSSTVKGGCLSGSMLPAYAAHSVNLEYLCQSYNSSLLTCSTSLVNCSWWRIISSSLLSPNHTHCLLHWWTRYQWQDVVRCSCCSCSSFDSSEASNDNLLRLKSVFFLRNSSDSTSARSVNTWWA